MMKFLLALVAAGMGFVILRMVLVKAGVLKQSPAKGGDKKAKMSQLRKELDVLLWAPPVLIVLGAIYAAVSMWMR